MVNFGLQDLFALRNAREPQSPNPSAPGHVGFRAWGYWWLSWELRERTPQRWSFSFKA